MNPAAAPIAPVTKLKDLWSNSTDYRVQCQGADEIGTIVRLLDLAQAEALVDIGCGNGAFAVPAAVANPRCKVWAFDALESATSQCQAAASAAGVGADRITIAQAWAESIPLPDATADRVLCRAVLHHILDASAAYREMARLLKQGGRLLLQAPCNFWERRWSQFISDLYMMMDDSHRRFYYQPAEVIAALAEVGLYMRAADCWTYTYSDLNEAQVAFIRDAGAQDRLRLRQCSDGRWQADLYWVRVVATKG